MEIKKERALIEKLSKDQSAILAEEILQIRGKNDTPGKKISHDEFCRVLAEIKHGIAKDFHHYDKDGRYTNLFLGSGLSVADLEIFKASLINKAAMLVAKRNFYTD
jgi:hypothetical protein